jgi:hypothetical protein
MLFSFYLEDKTYATQRKEGSAKIELGFSISTCCNNPPVNVSEIALDILFRLKIDRTFVLNFGV